MRLYHVLGLAMLCAVSLAAHVEAQPPAGESEREHAFVDALRREDPKIADRYVALRDARNQALAELRRAEAQYNAAGPDLRGLFTRPLVQAQKTYAETSLALLDFFDARDRDAVLRYQEEIGRINAALEARKKTREELEKLLAR